MRSRAQISEEILCRVAAIEADPVQMERLAAEQASVDALHAAIGRQATRRAHQLAESPAERAWPPIRVREAWTLARYGADQIGPGSATAVRLHRDRHAQLLRAVKRYERYIASARAADTAAARGAEKNATGDQLEELPERGWAAFLHLAATAGHHYPAGTIQALDVLSRRLRAEATINAPERLQAMQKRAQARHAPPKPHQFYRLPDRQWPAWLRLAPDGRPILVDDVDGPNRLALAIDHTHPQIPPASDPHRRLIERDAWLTHGHWPPIELDGRTHTHHRHHGLAEPATRPRPVDHELLELARLEPGLTLEQARRLSPELRGEMLDHARTRACRQHETERREFQQRLADTLGDLE